MATICFKLRMFQTFSFKMLWNVFGKYKTRKNTHFPLSSVLWQLLFTHQRSSGLMMLLFETLSSETNAVCMPVQLSTLMRWINLIKTRCMWMQYYICREINVKPANWVCRGSGDLLILWRYQTQDSFKWTMFTVHEYTVIVVSSDLPFKPALAQAPLLWQWYLLVMD